MACLVIPEKHKVTYY